MERLRGWLENLHWAWLVPLAIFAAMAPWPMGPEPHVIQKVRWLMEGSLYKPLDVFDLVFHLSPTLLVIAKLVVTRLPTDQGPATGSEG
jgi:hypothetical protein